MDISGLENITRQELIVIPDYEFIAFLFAIYNIDIPEPILQKDIDFIYSKINVKEIDKNNKRIKEIVKVYNDSLNEGKSFREWYKLIRL